MTTSHGAMRRARDLATGDRINIVSNVGATVTDTPTRDEDHYSPGALAVPYVTDDGRTGTMTYTHHDAVGDAPALSPLAVAAERVSNAWEAMCQADEDPGIDAVAEAIGEMRGVLAG